MTSDAPRSAEAPSLADLVARDGPMDPRRAAVLGIEVCGLLAADRARERRTVDADTLGLVAGRLQWLARTNARAVPALGAGSDAPAVARLVFLLATGNRPEGASARIRDVRPGLPPALALVVDRWLAAPVSSASRPASRGAALAWRRGGAEGRRRERLAELASELALACGLSGADGTGADPGQSAAATAGRRRLPAPALAMLGVALLALVALAATRRIGAARGDDLAPPAGFSAQEALVLGGLAEQGDALVRRDDFVGATQAYLRIGELARQSLHGESIVEAWHAVKLGWVRDLSWDYAGSAQHAGVGLGMIERTAPAEHPYRAMAAAVMALAETQRGEFDRAGVLLGDALRVRAAALGVEPPSRDVLTRLRSALVEVPAHWEWDEDGMLDILEMALGTNRKAPDSDSDGVLDVDEDADGDGAPDGLLYGLGFDASRVVSHGGAIDPQREGFWRIGRLTTGGVTQPRPGWRMQATGEAHYGVPFTSAQQRATRVQGWRLVLLVSIEQGSATATVDPAPAMQAFELRATRVSDTRLALEVSGGPGPIEIAAARGAAIALELQYLPGCDCARLRQRNAVLLDGLRGDRGRSGRWGFTFGVAGTQSRPADATFQTALLEIRH